VASLFAQLKMFRSIFLVALCASQAYAQTWYTLAGKYPTGVVTPVNDFSVVLTFSETVQKTSNSVNMIVGDSTNSAADSNAVTVSCSGGLKAANWFNKIVLCPSKHHQVRSRRAQQTK
jgi:hypothetical protein